MLAPTCLLYCRFKWVILIEITENMELFATNRYLEDEAPKQSEVLLKQLFIQAEKRKKERENRKREGPCENEEPLPPSKKKKKGVSKATETPVPAKSQKTDVGTEVTQDANRSGNLQSGKLGKKKKKKKAKQPANNNNQQENQQQDLGFTLIGEVEDEESKKVKKVVPDWMSQASFISDDLHQALIKVSGLPELDPTLVSLLQENGIEHFFPVQSHVIPYLLDAFKNTCFRPRDLCVSAPTGSGKTLAFALPIIQALRNRVVCSIRALIVLPVVNLATQVYQVFRTYCKGSGLQVGLAVGQAKFEIEQSMLIRKGYRGFHSQVDILICTPGRLVDHITNTPGFILKDLRFIVIDEADRIMQQIKQSWLNHVEQCFNGNKETIGTIPLVPSRLEEIRRIPQKLLFSATLTQNPEKIQQLKLFQPKLFTTVLAEANMGKNGIERVHDDAFARYTTPKELVEFYVSCKLAIKPLILLHFIHNLKYRYMLCFTNSVQSSHRLYLLLATYGGVKVQEFSSQLNVRHRNKILKKFAQGMIDVLVCSDVLARGMDIENVQYVVSYDMPHFIKAYVHRVGRTARAGRKGTAISLLQPHEVPKFKVMMLAARTSSVDELEISQSLLEPMEEKYKGVLKKVADIVAEELQRGNK